MERTRFAARKQRAVQLLLGHTKLESTVRYLGIEVDDALEVAEHRPEADSRCRRGIFR
jgi:site-specific recombinase XerC